MPALGYPVLASRSCSRPTGPALGFLRDQALDLVLLTVLSLEFWRCNFESGMYLVLPLSEGGNPSVTTF